MKIRKIKFNNHEILGNLELNFCDKNGNAVDTIFIAGENGTGKSTILEEIYKIVNDFNEDEISKFSSDIIVHIELEEKNKRFYFTLEYDSDKNYYFVLEENNSLKTDAIFQSIFSDICMNFDNKIRGYGILKNDIDMIERDSTKSSSNLISEINQLLIDIENDDNLKFREKITKGLSVEDTKKELKITRFKNAFNKIFDNLEYDGLRRVIGKIKYHRRISRVERYEDIIFKRNNKEISIDDLSSGEKQIVYRGSFLLKDKNALNGAIVLIDEPEISLHPDWQMKIMDFYKGIFTNEEGIQTSQIIVVTHSPFILHNYNRTNDKVIVLKRENNEIKVMDKPEFYSIGEKVAIQEAFNIRNWIDESKNIIFVEGKTDIYYFNKAIEIFDMKEEFSNIEFKTAGKSSDKEDYNNGWKNLFSTYKNIKNHKLPEQKINNHFKILFLFDCDCIEENDVEQAQKSEWKNNARIKILEKKDNKLHIKKGIENLLTLDSMKEMIERDYKEDFRTSEKDGSELILKNKTKLCDEICNKTDKKELRKIFENFKNVLEDLQNIFKN